MGLGLLSAGPGRAQVQVQTLAAPDLFSVGAGTSDLPPDLWQGSSAALLRTAIPQLAARPLSPAAAGLARHLLAAPGNAPEGAGDDPALAGARAEALLQLGDAAGAETIAAGTPALAQKPELSRVAAEAALIRGEEDRACSIGDGLINGREGAFWLRLRAFCQAKAGQTAPAQLTFELAEQQGHSADFDRLMTALLAGQTDTAPALDDALDYAISKRVSAAWTGGLSAAARATRLGFATPEAYAAVSPVPADVVGADQPGAAGEGALVALAAGANDLNLKEAAVIALLKRAKDGPEFQALARLASPSIGQIMAAHPVLRDPALFAAAAAAAGDAASARAARALVGQGMAPPSPLELALLDALIAAAASQPDASAVAALDVIAAQADGSARARAAAAMALLAGLGAPLGPQARFDVATANLGAAGLASARMLALDQAAEAGRMGDAGLYVLISAADAGAPGPPPGDRALLVRALARVHLDADARAYAVEGLVALQGRP